MALNFARRPFRDERPVFFVAGAMLVITAILLVANARLYVHFRESVAGTSQQIEYLQKRKARALQDASRARTALDSYRVSNLASESQGLLRVVAERRFSWTALLVRLERVLPTDVRVTRLSPQFEKEGITVGLSLVGKDADSVVHTIAALARDPAFSVIDLHSEATPERGVPEGRSFEVQVSYVAPQPRREHS